MNDCEFVVNELKTLAEESYRRKLSHFGIPIDKAIGVSVPKIRALAKQIGKNHELSLSLWETGIHEARILATIIGDPKKVTESQMDHWLKDVNSWDICDHACGNLFVFSPFALQKARAYMDETAEFVKRAGFVLIAQASMHLKKHGDDVFIDFMPLLEKGASDPRNFVKKAVSWALRQVGKKNCLLNLAAIAAAENMLNAGDKNARWVALDALRELKSDSVQRRVEKR